jgi:hypothetical protein
LWGAFCPTEHDEAIVNCKSIAKRKKGRSTTIVKTRNATNISNEVDAIHGGWVGCTMRRRNRKQFGVLRQTVDLLAQAEESRRRNPNNPHIEVVLQYHRKHPE